jgi:hypothetical protein
VAFLFRLQRKERNAGRPADVSDSCPDWRSGDTIPLGPGRILRVIEIRPGSKPRYEPARLGGFDHEQLAARLPRRRFNPTVSYTHTESAAEASAGRRPAPSVPSAPSDRRRGRRASPAPPSRSSTVVINKAWRRSRRRHRCATLGHRPGGQACVRQYSAARTSGARCGGTG